MTTLKIKLEYGELKTFVNIVTGFESDIDIVKGRYTVDAKSIMGILSLDFSKDIEVRLHSENEEEIARFKKVMEVFKRGE